MMVIAGAAWVVAAGYAARSLQPTPFLMSLPVPLLLLPVVCSARHRTAAWTAVVAAAVLGYISLERRVEFTIVFFALFSGACIVWGWRCTADPEGFSYAETSVIAMNVGVFWLLMHPAIIRGGNVQVDPDAEFLYSVVFGSVGWGILLVGSLVGVFAVLTHVLHWYHLPPSKEEP